MPLRQFNIENEQNSLLFRNILLTASIFLAFYSAVYLYLGAPVTAAFMGLGLLILTVLMRLNGKKQFTVSSRLVFVTVCVFCITASEQTLMESIDAQSYFLPAMTLSLFFFDARQKKALALGIIIPLIGWAVILVPWNFNLPPSLVPHDFPYRLFRVLNFFGAYAITAINFVLYIRSVNRLQKNSISQVKKHNQELTTALERAESSERLISQLFNATPDLLFVKGRDHRYLRVNEGYGRALKRDPDYFIGKNDLDLGFPEEFVKGNPGKNIPGFWKDDEAVMDSGEVRVIENDHIQIDGKLRIFHTIKIPLKDGEGVPFAVLGFARDITNLLEMERVRRESEAKLLESAKLSSLGEMAAGIAHEINNPLAIIIGKATQLARKIEAPEIPREIVVEELNKIRLTAERIAKIVRGLRTLARDSEGDPMELAALKSIVQEVVDVYRHKFALANIDLRVEIQTDSELTCRPAQIGQVVVNLLTNSLDAVHNLSEKWVEICLKQEGDSAKIILTDSGHGIAPAVAEKMMKPYFTTKPSGKGTGLGLSISKEIIESHGGSLRYDPAHPTTRFVIEMPVAGKKQFKKAA